MDEDGRHVGDVFRLTNLSWSVSKDC